ncbi:MAG: CocE/NonD family hydrolase [Bacillota bacterium]
MNKVFEVRTADGVLLSTQVETPDGSGPWPVIVARTPYSKAGMARGLSGMVQRGYAVAVQDVRGTGESGGVFAFLKQEVPDAIDTGRWILEQSFCDGNLGLLGISYLAAASLGIALSFPENVKAAVWVAPVLGGRSLFHVDGALRLHHNLPWTALSHPRFRELDWRSIYRYLPLNDALDSVGIDSPLWRSICEDRDRIWAENDFAEVYHSLNVPGLHFGGFWDFMLDSSLFAWEASARPGAKPQALFLGPWSHNGMASEATKNEYADYGPGASSAFSARVLQWFDHHLKGQELCSDLATPVSAYVPGPGWVRMSAWPDPAALPYDLYLGAGSLEPEPGEAGRLSYVYDPSDPVPTEGGALWEFPRAGLNPGPAPVTTGNRDDVLVFQGRGLREPVVALGPAQVDLYVETDAPSTDFTAKLVDVGIDGTPRIVADSICRITGPGRVQVIIRLLGIGHVFDKGHRIRLDVSSSNFPRFDRNLNTGVPGLVSSQMKVARQTVQFGPDSPSRVRLNLLCSYNP